MSELLANFAAKTYRYGIRPILFRFDSERVHNRLTAVGGYLGSSSARQKTVARFFGISSQRLSQRIAGIDFSNPIGLAAGFDYQAQLSEILPSLGFGFGTVGTFSNDPYQGNPPPRLARLVKSKSLLVNKGFKNAGIDWLIAHAQQKKLTVPVGLSLGRTNRPMDEHEAISDIQAAFTKAEKAELPYTHYELNISCPNLTGTVSFYEPKSLRKLLRALRVPELSKPLFVKMPIDQTNERTLELAEIIANEGAAGVIIGNLQKDRSHPALFPDELKKCGKGNFSGKPTWDRSNELIELIYKKLGKRIIVIGCGGVFSAEDAYTKIRLGASLVQLVTGLIFEGPQLPSQINYGILRLLERDKLAGVSQAVGSGIKNSPARG